MVQPALRVIFWIALTAVQSSSRVCPSSSQLHRELKGYALCTELKRVCVDHNAYVLFDHPEDQPLPLPPELSAWNWPGGKIGNGDKLAKGYDYPFDSPLYFRRAEPRGREACTDLNQPSFNNCTVPIIWYPWFPFNIGEIFTRSFTPLHAALGSRWMQRDLRIVTAAPGGLAPPRFTQLILQTLSPRRVSHLGAFASRANTDCSLADEPLVGNPQVGSILLINSTNNDTEDSAILNRRLMGLHSTEKGSGLRSRNLHAQQADSTGAKGMMRKRRGSGRCYESMLVCGTNHTDKPASTHAYAAGRHIQAYYANEAAAAPLPPVLAKWRTVALAAPEPGPPDTGLLPNSRPSSRLGKAVLSLSQIGVRDEHEAWQQADVGRRVQADTHTASQSEGRVMKVVFVRRLSTLDRMLINQAELMDACKAWRQPISSPHAVLQAAISAALEINPPAEVIAALKGTQLPANMQWQFSSTECTEHDFGADLLADLAVLDAADVLVAVHGAACVDLFLMRQYTSLIEIRPYEFDPWWSNGLYRYVAEMDRKHFWWGLDVLNASLSRDPALTGHPLTSQFTEIRDRHVILPPAALTAMLNKVAVTGRDPAAYRYMAASGLGYTDERSVPVAFNMSYLGVLPPNGWASWKAAA